MDRTTYSGVNFGLLLAVCSEHPLRSLCSRMVMENRVDTKIYIYCGLGFQFSLPYTQDGMAQGGTVVTLTCGGRK